MHSREKIIITGSNGLLGTQCLSELASEYDVVAIVKEEPTYKISDVTYIQLDLTDSNFISKLPDDADHILHFAQSTHYKNFPEKALDIFDVNIRSTALLLEYGRKVKIKNFIFTSSGGIYGSGGKTYNERDRISIDSHLGYYLNSKICAEGLVHNYSSFFETKVVRPFFIYGPRQSNSMLIPRLINNVKNSIPITLQGDVGIQINPIHVKDAAFIIKGLLQVDGSLTINAAGTEVLSIKDIACIIAEHTNLEPIFEQVEGTPKCLVGDIELLTKLNLSPKISFQSGVRELLDEE